MELYKNGIWKTDYLKERVVPKEYTQVDYLEATGTQYIDTNFKPNQDTSLYVTFDTSNDDRSAQFIAGARTTSETKGYTLLYWKTNSKKMYSAYGAGNIQSNYQYILGEKISLFLDKNKYYINNVLYTTHTYTNFQCDYNLALFTVNNSGTFDSQRLYGKIYECKIYDNNKLIRNFIPVIRNSDCKPGMYDTEMQIFYTNQGTGEFLYGKAKLFSEEYTPLAYIENINGAYIDTDFTPDYTNGFRVEVEYEPTVANARYCVLSSYDTTNHISIEINTNNQSRFYYRGSIIDDKINGVILSKNKLIIEYSNGTIKHNLNGVESIVSGITETTSYPWYMFVDRQLRTEVFNNPLKIYRCRLFNNNILFRDFVPALHNIDQKIGMYDKISNRFFTNKGAGYFKYEIQDFAKNYVQVEYIESSGTQYIDTGFSPNANTVWELRFRAILESAVPYYGSFVSGQRFRIDYNSVGLSSKYVNFPSQNGQPSLGQDYTVIWNSKDLWISINGGKTLLDTTAFTNDINIYLFAENHNSAGTNLSKGTSRFYYSKLYQNDVLVRDYIPCYRKSDGEIGVYDFVTNTFFPNAGTGTFVKGNDYTFTGNAKVFNDKLEANNFIEI